MNVLVCGSRSLDTEAVEEIVRERLREFSPYDVVLHGGAAGPDIFAYRAALDLGLTAHSFLPDYKTHGNSAPHVRNDAMLDRADTVLAFWDGKSRGTQSVIRKARRLGISVEIVTPLYMKGRHD